MKTVHFQITMDVEDNCLEKLKKLEHHADWLLDLSSWPEIISVYECHVAEIQKEEKDETSKTP